MASSLLTPMDLSLYNEKGYIVLNDIIPDNCFDDFFEEFSNLLVCVCKKAMLDVRNYSGIAYEEHVDSLLIKLYSNNKDSAGFFYDLINKHQIFFELFRNQNLIHAVNSILKLEDGSFSLSRTDEQFFIHIPIDTAENIGWHQDSSYFYDNCSFKHSLIVWMPLKKCYPENGSLIAIPKSHLAGRLNHRENEHDSRKKQPLEKRGRFFIEVEDYSANQEALMVERGSVVLMHIDSIHRSGINLSDSVRYTAIARFSNVLAPGYLGKKSIW